MTGAELTQSRAAGCISIDVEDWFHILDSPAVPPMDAWASMESRLQRNVERLLTLLAETDTRATFFWLGWAAERHAELVRRCQAAGHEIASHGYGHVLAYEVGSDAFRQDVHRAKALLEDVTGQQVRGFRAAGFGIRDREAWAFDVIREAGHDYDSSIFPGPRGHGGMASARLGLHVIETASGPLVECPMSAVEVLGRRLSLFGGGYLRLAPRRLIRWGIKRLHASGHPLIIYAHPRETDPDHPRLPLSLKRRFKSYVNLKSTMPKLDWLCRRYAFCTMSELVDAFRASADHGTNRSPAATGKQTDSQEREE